MSATYCSTPGRRDVAVAVVVALDGQDHRRAEPAQLGEQAAQPLAHAGWSRSKASAAPKESTTTRVAPVRSIACPIWASRVSTCSGSDLVEVAS